MADSNELNIESSFVMELAKELVSMVSNIVIKREDLAQRYETADTVRSYDQYYYAINGIDTFDTYPSFPVDVLEQAGLTQTEISQAMLSKRNIPESKRGLVIQLQRQKTIEEFVELNDYYRMLNGLPFTSDALEIYIQQSVPGVDTSKPVHLMTNDEIIILDNMGHIQDLIERYPDRAYLRYLGPNKIDIITARQAKRFDILRFGTVTNQQLKDRFDINYERSKTYILNNFYKRRFSIDQTYFDAYIGLAILVNALVMSINDSVDIYNSREFSTDQIVSALLRSYGMTMFDDVPFIYRKNIADNINSLIVSKGTDEVIYKIFRIFGFDDIRIRKFILVKEHLKDQNGDYIFEYEDDGVTPKYNDMYDIHFAQVDISASNIDNEIRRPENKLGYYDVIASDIYWGGYESDEDIRQRLLREDFNYIDTDYININTAYEMSKLSLEVSYFFSTVLGLKNYLERITYVEPIRGQSISIFYAITMLCALLSRKVGFDGNIITDPEDIAVVNKFNFDRSIGYINQIMAKYGYKSTEQFAPILPSTQYTRPSQIVDLYFRNRDIYEKLVEIITNTRDLNEYLACKEILEYISQSKVAANIYTKTDGTIASTYMDYLGDKNQVLYSHLLSLEDQEIDNTIFTILTSLEEFVRSDKLEYLFLKIPTVYTENVMKTYMLKVINTFKAFTINIFSMSITYNIDDMRNNIKILDDSHFEGHRFTHKGFGLVDAIGIRGNVSKTSNIRISDELELLS